MTTDSSASAKEYIAVPKTSYTAIAFLLGLMCLSIISIGAYAWQRLDRISDNQIKLSSDVQNLSEQVSQLRKSQQNTLSERMVVEMFGRRDDRTNNVIARVDTMESRINGLADRLNKILRLYRQDTVFRFPLRPELTRPPADLTPVQTYITSVDPASAPPVRGS